MKRKYDQTPVEEEYPYDDMVDDDQEDDEDDEEDQYEEEDEDSRARKLARSCAASPAVYSEPDPNARFSPIQETVTPPDSRTSTPQPSRPPSSAKSILVEAGETVSGEHYELHVSLEGKIPKLEVRIPVPAPKPVLR